MSVIDDFMQLIEVYEASHAVGEWFNDHYIQVWVDHHSEELAQYYHDHLADTFDPAVDAIHHALDQVHDAAQDIVNHYYHHDDRPVDPHDHDHPVDTYDPGHHGFDNSHEAYDHTDHNYYHD